MANKKWFKMVNKRPVVPARYCRNCGKRIQVVLRTEYLLPPGETNHALRLRNEEGQSLQRYTGKFRYTRSEYFHSYMCAESFAEKMVALIDEGVLTPGPGKVWNDVTLGKGKEE